MQIEILLSLFIVVNAINHDHDILQKWKQFQVKYGKKYRSPVEAQRRFINFKNNVEKIHTHDALFNDGVVSYQMEINKFADLSLNDITERDKNNLNIVSGLSEYKYYNKSENFDLPASIDWRQNNAVTNVRNEGDCQKASYAISTAGAMEGQWAIKTGDLIPISSQNLIDCSQSEGNWGCAGGSRLFTFDYIQKYGIESEEDYPFVEIGGQCSADASKTLTKISEYVFIEKEDEEALQQAIVTQGPISAGIDKTLAFVLYKSGIFDDKLCGHYSMGHNVLVVGFGTENDKDYYIVKNSWGENWGESGYFRLARNQGNKCGIATLAIYPVL